VKRLLWVSCFVPYDKVDHAGGKVHNFYLKGIERIGDYEIKLVSLARESELEKIDLKNYNIEYEIVGVYHEVGCSRLYKIQQYRDKFVRANIFDKHAGFVKPIVSKGIIKCLRKYKKNGYIPDIIILQWTQVVLLFDQISCLFPNSKIVAIEEDVSFLLYWRKYLNEKCIHKKMMRKILFYRLKKKELEVLSKVDLVVVNNAKDEQLLVDENISSEIFRIIPYYQSFIEHDYVGDEKYIVMYGAMDRVENYSSVIWFIENVYGKIDKKNNLKLVVIGARPDARLLKYNSEMINITGFVDDVSNYLEHSMCMVAPLLLGAGIKIKILEALSAGVPVLTNAIGAEGIGIKDKIHYFHCEQADEYLETIKEICNGDRNISVISKNAKDFMRRNFDLSSTITQLNEKLLSLE
jgi:glycosyltransferase involved in cell wall biosynthesis